MDVNKIKSLIKETAVVTPRPQPLSGGGDYYGYNDDMPMMEKEIPSTEELLASKYGNKLGGSMGVNQSQMEQPISEERFANSKLPKEILESFSKTKIDTPNSLGGESPADLTKLFGENVTKRPPATIQEQTQHSSPAYVPQTNSGIDYSIIKAIIRQELDEKFKELYDKLDNGEVVMIKIDSKLSLVDKQNRLYQGKLESKGKIS